jgi:hypothetical protein
MTFINPGFLFALLAVSIPIAIHLLSKPKLRRIPWAATRLLQASLQKNRNKLNIEDLLLLILRCILIALLALLFARPALLTAVTGLHLSDEPVTAVILLDHSASMGQSDGVKTRFDKAKETITEVLAQMKSGSKAALYLTSDQAKGVIPQPTQDLPTVRHAVEDAVVTDRGSDLYPGLKTAVDLLKGEGGRKEIILCTDSQVSAWRDLAKIRQLFDENKKSITFRFLVIGDKGEDNVAITGLNLIGTVAAVGQPVRCAVQVTNFSKTAATQVLVKLGADDGAPQDQAMIDRIDPGASRTVSLFVRFKDPGYHSITAFIPGDRLPSDNERSTALMVIDQMQALIVEGTSGRGADADGFFLDHALTPVSPEKLKDYYLKVKKGPSTLLESPTLNQYQAVFLAGVSQLSGNQAKNLAAYVNQGGVLIIFPGPTANLDFYNNNADFKALMPAKFGPAAEAPSDQKFIALQSKDYEHPVTSLWNDPQSGSLGTVRFFKYFPLLPPNPLPPADHVVVKYANGEIAAAEQAVGKGKVFLFGAPATTEWGNLPIHPSFVPLLARILSYATGSQTGRLIIAPGQPFAFSLGAEYVGKDVFVGRPGHKDERRLSGKAEPSDQAALLRYASTDTAGVYRLFTDDSPAPKVSFAVQMDPSESDLQQAPAKNIEPFLKAVETGSDAAAPAAASPQMVPGREFWFALAVTALLLALLETGLAHRFSQSK